MRVIVGLGALIALSVSSIVFGSTTSSEVQAKGPDGPLVGTLVAVSDKAPLVLIIPGSGPTDRDGNNRLGVSASSYRLLAEELALQGISTIRIDKRGMFGSVKAIADANNVSISDYVSDTNAWIDAIQKSEPKRKCVWLLGHSEGGIVALVTAKDNDRVCGVIAAATPGRKLNEVIREQLNANPANAPVLPDAMHAIDELEAGRKLDVSKMHPALQGLFAPSVQGFLISLFATDPAVFAGSMRQPLLIVQGGRDIQVAYSDAERLARSQPNAELLKIDEMTHTLKEAKDGSRAAIMATYADASGPIDKRMVEAVTVFVKARRH